MTNADKYLKDGVDVEELEKEFGDWYAQERRCNSPQGYLMQFLKERAKPILTEDEKVILSYINTDIYAKIGRYENGEIIFRNIHDSYIVLTPYFKLENMFQFIQPRRRICY